MPAGRGRASRAQDTPTPTDDNGFTAADVIVRVFDIDRHAGAGFDLKFDRHQTVYGLDDRDQVRHIVESGAAADPRFARPLRPVRPIRGARPALNCAPFQPPGTRVEKA